MVISTHGLATPATSKRPRRGAGRRARLAQDLAGRQGRDPLPGRRADRRRADAIAAELTAEEGKTLPEARGEVGRASAILRFFAGECSQPMGDVLPSAADRTLLYTAREPLGVVGIITPWNFPIAIPAWKIAPALAYGNTVVFKPSDLTPLTRDRLAEALDEAGLPPGVLNL